MPDEVVLDVRDLTSVFVSEHGEARAVDQVSFTLKKGQTLGLVGESGSGKSVTALSLVDLLPKPSGRVISGFINFKGKDLRQVTTQELHAIRGRHIGMIFQEPMTALNPVKKIGRQITEVLETHFPNMTKIQIKDRAMQLLTEVGIALPEQRFFAYPHQLSGGMRQRVMIAIALACEPDILIADEPTTALDVTIQAQILELMKRVQKQHGMAMLFITHDLGVIAELADEVAVMYGGRIVERATVHQLYEKPYHPYSQGLLRSIPRLTDQSKSKLQTIEGMVPSIFESLPGCRFQNRCQYANDECRAKTPPLIAIHDTANHEVACFNVRKKRDSVSA